MFHNLWMWKFFSYNWSPQVEFVVWGRRLTAVLKLTFACWNFFPMKSFRPLNLSTYQCFERRIYMHILQLYNANILKFLVDVTCVVIFVREWNFPSYVSYFITPRFGKARRVIDRYTYYDSSGILRDKTMGNKLMYILKYV